MNKLRGLSAVMGTTLAVGLIMLFAAPVHVFADHVGAHATPCNDPDTVGGGQPGISPGPTTPATSLGWDVGTGQCNGSFTVTRDVNFPSSGSDGIELGLRIEQRSVGQVQRNGDDYQVELGNDTTQPNVNRAWWNFQHSIAYDGDIDTDLDRLTFTIRTDAGPNLPSAPSFDMLGVVAPSTTLRDLIDDRNNQPNATATFSDLYQTSQNPEFSWFTVGTDTTVPLDNDFDYSKEGAWRMTLTAEKDGHTVSVSICVHTPNASCLPLPDHFLCYNVAGKPVDEGVTLEDQFSDIERTVSTPRTLCVPVDKNGEGILNPNAHLVCYEVGAEKGVPRERPVNVEVQVINQFGTQTLRVVRPNILCVPSTKVVIE